MTNTGVEVDLNGTIINTRNITWSVNANLTWYKNKISYLPEERKTMEIDGHRGYSSGSHFYGEGLPLYSYRMYRYAGVNQEDGTALYYHKVLDDNNKPTGELEKVSYEKLTNNDYFILDSALPKVYGGFGTQVSAYGFDLSLDFGYSLGGKVYDGQYSLFMGNPSSTSKGYNWHADILKAWTPEKPSKTIPRLQFDDKYATSTSDRFLESADYLSLNTINFGYTLPQSITAKMFLTKLRVYFQAENVWIWAKRQGIDPRQSLSGSINNTYYAPIRTLTGGLTVTF